MRSYATKLVLCVSLGLSCLALNVDASPAPRIVGGQEATRGEYPFIAALLTPRGGDALQSQICGGSIIDSKWVLTAAHCVRDSNGTDVPAENFEVGLGFFDLSNDTGERINVKAIHVHPQYGVGGGDSNDIALLELERATTQPKVALVSSDTEAPVGTNATVIGWGLTDPNDDQSYTSILNEVSVPIVSNQTCAAAYGDSLTDVMLCAGLAMGGKDSCQGDSGGPLIVNSGGTWKQAGIVSFGTGCAQAGYYGVYSRVAALRSFIDQYVKDDSEPVDNGPKTSKYGLWNGFVSMVNILELMNRTELAQEVRIHIYSITGQLVSTNKRTVSPNQQLDIVVNSLPGFLPDSYGLVRVESRIDSRVFYYRPTDSSFTNFEYAFGVEVSDPLTGTTSVGFNTYQPSLRGGDLSNVVANWLSVVNLSTSQKRFVITKYGMQGNKISSYKVDVNALGRVDLDGGHVNPGAKNVGLIEIAPEDNSAPYLSQLMRYGYATGGGFDFAFPLIGNAGKSTPIYLPAGSEFSAQNWLEIANTTAASASAQVLFYDESGDLKKSQSVKLAAHGQAHLDVTGILGARHIGGIMIVPSGAAKLIAQSMFYFYGSDSGIAAMYGIQGESGTTTVRTGSYNLFLGMENYLKITNFSDNPGSFGLLVSSATAEGSSQSFSLLGHQTVSLPLHEFSTYGTANDTYGVVSLTPNSGSTIISQIVRVGYDDAQEIEFSAPTAMK